MKCGQCDRELNARSASIYFCNDDCQSYWHESKANMPIVAPTEYLWDITAYRDLRNGV